MSGISSVYILDHKGRVLITRSYRGDVPLNIQESFNKKLLELDETSLKPIIILDDGITFFHKQVSNLTFLAVSNKNSNAMMVFLFLSKLIEVLTDYFKELEEESIRDNFVVIYELLDEMMDNGYPQTTEAKILSEFIKTEKHQLFRDSKKEQINEMNMVKSLSNVVFWRKEGIQYRKNEVYLDVVEKVNMTINSNGNVVKSEILGCLKMRSQLSGMPELKLGLNDKALYDKEGKNTVSKKTIEMNDLKFHPCVRLSKFTNDRQITFIPPDGDFDLVSYRLDITVKPLIMVEVIVENRSNTRYDLTIRANSNFKEKCTSNNTEILIPVPCDAQKPILKTATGDAVYKPEKEAICWSIKSFQGHKEINLHASFSLPTVASPDRDNFLKAPIQVVFEIPYFTVSGIQVRYLKVEDKSGYQAYPWVRYISKNGDYHIRMGI